MYRKCSGQVNLAQTMKREVHISSHRSICAARIVDRGWLDRISACIGVRRWTPRTKWRIGSHLLVPFRSILERLAVPHLCCICRRSSSEGSCILQGCQCSQRINHPSKDLLPPRAAEGGVMVAQNVAGRKLEYVSFHTLIWDESQHFISSATCRSRYVRVACDFPRSVLTT